jgi:hypothetical protein
VRAAIGIDRRRPSRVAVGATGVGRLRERGVEHLADARPIDRRRAVAVEVPLRGRLITRHLYDSFLPDAPAIRHVDAIGRPNSSTHADTISQTIPQRAADAGRIMKQSIYHEQNLE